MGVKMIFYFLSESGGCLGCRSVRFVQMERAVSIRIQSENSISLKGYKSRPTRVKGVTELVDPYGLYRWKGRLNSHSNTLESRRSKSTERIEKKFVSFENFCKVHNS